MATCSTCGGAMLTEQPHRHPDPLRGKVQRPPHNHPTDSHCLIRECPRGAWDAAMGVHLTGDERLGYWEQRARAAEEQVRIRDQALTGDERP